MTGELRIVSGGHVKGLCDLVIVDAGEAARHVQAGVFVHQGAKSWRVWKTERDAHCRNGLVGLFLRGDGTPTEGSLWL